MLYRDFGKTGLKVSALGFGCGRVGGLLLGLTESFGIALLGTSYRNLFAFVLLVAILVLRPNGLFASRRQLPPEPLTASRSP